MIDISKRTIFFFLICTVFLILRSQKINIPVLSNEEMESIGKKIWFNESNQSLDGLLFWDPKEIEKFPSLGIGHFIWYPSLMIKDKQETFPQLIKFFKKNGIWVPSWMEGPCPWPTREEFIKAQKSEQFIELRNLLKSTISLQAKFIIERFEKAIPDILEKSPLILRNKIEKFLLLLFSTNEGVFAVIDYINFKGEGICSVERYKGQGWGLMQVLERMISKEKTNKKALVLFIESAKEILQERVELAVILGRDERSFLRGWLNRINRYH